MAALEQSTICNFAIPKKNISKFVVTTCEPLCYIIAAPRALHGYDKAEHLSARAFWDNARQGILERCPPGPSGTMPARAFWNARQGILGRHPPDPFGTMPARAFWDNPARAFCDDTLQGLLGQCPPGH